ncbi:MAG: hypothetical protein Fur006_45520 [Coleofasciculaceae cyanobacterium]
MYFILFQRAMNTGGILGQSHINTREKNANWSWANELELDLFFWVELPMDWG